MLTRPPLQKISAGLRKLFQAWCVFVCVCVCVCVCGKGVSPHCFKFTLAFENRDIQIMIKIGIRL